MNWRNYFIEAWGLGTFMFIAGTVAIALAHAPPPLAASIAAHPILGRFIFGVLMGLTAMSIIYSPWGARSGAHLNPAVTLTFAWLRKIAPRDAVFYIAAQCIGGTLGLAVLAAIAHASLVGPPVNAIVTEPGSGGIIPAFAAEVTIAFIMMTVVLTISNARLPLQRYTGIAAGMCVTAFITFESPLSGMGLNPARTLSSAIVANHWSAIWIYFTAPVIGMLIAAIVYTTVRGWNAVHCARLNHTGPFPCIFRCSHDAIAPVEL